MEKINILKHIKYEQHFEIITCENVAFYAMRENVNLNGKPSSIKK